MPEEYYDRDFPELKKRGFKRTSEPAYYNCIAFTVGDLQRRWWPGTYDPKWSDDYWPDVEPRDDSLAAFLAGLATVHYLPCPDGGWEHGFEKIALYGLNEAVVRHAALQIQEGLWRSKLGPGEDIEHTLEGLVGPLYGSVIAYLKRPRAVEETVSQAPISEPEAG